MSAAMHKSITLRILSALDFKAWLALGAFLADYKLRQAYPELQA